MRFLTGTISDLLLRWDDLGRDPLAIPEPDTIPNYASFEDLIRAIHTQSLLYPNREPPMYWEYNRGFSFLLTTPDTTSVNALAFADPYAYYRVCVYDDAADDAERLREGDTVGVSGRAAAVRVMEIDGCPWPGLRYVTDFILDALHSDV